MFSLGLAASFVCKAWTKKTLIQKSIRRSMCTCTEYPKSLSNKKMESSPRMAQIPYCIMCKEYH